MSSVLIDAVRLDPTCGIDTPARLQGNEQLDLLRALAAVPDPRHRCGVRYRLASLLAVAVCAVLAGRPRSPRSATGPPTWTRRPAARSASPAASRPAARYGGS